MKPRNDLRQKVQQVAGPLMGAAMMVYFGYHAVQGERGLIAWWELRREIEEADFDLAAVMVQKNILEHRVSLLRPESLDRDMLEERARVMLGVVHADDLIVLDPAADAAASAR